MRAPVLHTVAVAAATAGLLLSGATAATAVPGPAAPTPQAETSPASPTAQDPAPRTDPPAADAAPVVVRRQGPLRHLVAACPAGRQVRSGGFEIPGHDLEQTVNASRPTDDGRGWLVDADAVNPKLLLQYDVVQRKQTALDHARTRRQRAAAERELRAAQYTADHMPQRAAVRGTAVALCG